MSRRTIFAGLAVLAIAAFTFGPDRDWDRNHRSAEIVQAVDDQGQPLAGPNTFIIERGGPGFFPFGIFFVPLGILFFFFGVLRLVFGPRWGGPSPWHGQREEWLNDWHRRQHDEPVTIGDLEIDLPRMRVTVADSPVDLTATEFALLSTMAQQPGRVFTRQQLLQAIHGTMVEAYERAIDAHIKNIRRKLEAREGYVQTVHGVGYRVSDAA